MGVFFFFGLVFGFIFVVSWFNSRCPSCKACNTLKPTGVIHPEKNQHEYVCRACGYQEWRSPSSGGVGSCVGCGGSGGG